MDTVHQLLQQLHFAAKTYQAAKVTVQLEHLLRLAGLTERCLMQKPIQSQECDAMLFWRRLLEAERASTEILKKSAHSFYAVIAYVAAGGTMLSMKNQAGSYCEHIAEVCERLLYKVEIVRKPSQPALRLMQGGRS